MGFGIWNTAQGIRNPILRLESGIQIPLTKSGIQYLQSGTDSLESKIQDCLGFSYMGQKINHMGFSQSLLNWLCHR